MRYRVSIAVVAALLVCGAGFAFADGSCLYQDIVYLNGSDVCQTGSRYRCENGDWQQMSAPCALQYFLAQGSCDYEGQSYASGRVTCESDTGILQRCDRGRWQTLREPCIASAGALAAAARPRTCRYRDAQFPSQSIMCIDGTTFVCEGGAWTSLFTACE